MRNIFSIFGLRREERWPMLALLVAIVGLNAMLVCKYYGVFTPLTRFYWPLFIHNFHVSGFDPITYSVVSDWSAGYNIYRHPLLAYYMYVPYLINQGLMWLTGINCAIFVVAAIEAACAFYSALFLRRILREIIGLGNGVSTLITYFFFSFAFVMLSAMVPDHFGISMAILLLALYVSGRRMISGRQYKIWQTVVYFLLTAGTSLNNGLKIFLSALFVNRRRFFSPKFLLCAVVIPSAFIWCAGRVGYAKLVWPREMAQKKARAERKAAREKKEQEQRLAQWRTDSLRAAASPAAADTLGPKPAAKPAPAPKKKRRARQGAPISNGEFMRWTDITTSRTQSVVENLFGESIQLHPDYLLEDEFRNRPMIVHYRWAVNYAVEAAVVLLFILGVWCGRRSRFMWLCMSYFGLDMVLHIGLGFGINEVYIMSAHWIYVIPIAIGYLIKAAAGRPKRAALAAVAVLAAWLWIYNVALISKYLLC